MNVDSMLNPMTGKLWNTSGPAFSESLELMKILEV